MKKAIIALFTLAITISTYAQEAFKIKVEKDKVINFEMLLKTDIEGSQDIIMDMSMLMSVKPIEVSDDTIILETKYSKIKMDVNAGIMMASYDSSQEPEDEITKMLASQIQPLLDATLILTMDPYGNIQNIEAPNVPNGLFDESNLKGITLGFPSKEITIGESWETSSETQLGINITITNTLTEKTAEGFKIEIKGNLYNQDGKVIGSQSGFYIIDPITKLTKLSETTTHIEVEGQKISSSVELKQIK